MIEGSRAREPQVGVARAANSHEEYEAARREVGAALVEEVRRSSNNRKAGEEEDIYEAVKRESIDPELRAAMEASLREQQQEHTSSGRKSSTPDIEPASFVRSRSHDYYEAIKQDSASAIDEQFFRASLSSSSNTPTKHRSSFTSVASTNRVPKRHRSSGSATATATTSTASEPEPSLVARLDRHGTYEAIKRESAGAIQQQFRASLTTHNTPKRFSSGDNSFRTNNTPKRHGSNSSGGAAPTTTISVPEPSLVARPNRHDTYDAVKQESAGTIHQQFKSTLATHNTPKRLSSRDNPTGANNTPKRLGSGESAAFPPIHTPKRRISNNATTAELSVAATALDNHDNYQTVEQEAMDEQLMAAMEASLRDRHSPRGSISTEPKRRSTSSSVRSSTEATTDVEPSLVARLEGHDMYDAVKRESAASVDQQVRVSIAGSSITGSSTSSRPSPRTSGGKDTLLAAAASVSNPEAEPSTVARRKSLVTYEAAKRESAATSPDSGLRSSTVISPTIPEPPMMVAVQGGNTTSMDHSEMDGSAASVGRHTAGDSSSSIGRRFNAMDSSSARHASNVNGMDASAASRDSNFLTNQIESDARMKAGLRNNSRAAPGVVAVGAAKSGDTSRSQTPARPTSQADADRRLKAGLKQARNTGTVPTAGAATSRSIKPPPPAKVSSQADADTRMKAGLKQTRTTAQPGVTAVSHSNSENNTGADSGNSQADADARLKSGLRKPRSSMVTGTAAIIASDDATEMNDTSASSQVEADARMKAGLRNSRIGASRAPSANSVPGAASVPGTSHRSGLHLTEAEMTKFGMASNRSGLNVSTPSIEHSTSGSESFRTQPPSSRSAGLRHADDAAVAKFNMRTLRSSSASAEPEFEIPGAFRGTEHTLERIDSAERGEMEIDVTGGISDRHDTTNLFQPTQKMVDHGVEQYEAAYSTATSQPVEDQMEDEMLDEEKKMTHFKWWIILLAVLAVIVVVVVVGAVVGTSSRSSGDGDVSDSRAPTLPPTTEPPFFPLSFAFPNTTLPPDTVRAIESQRSPLPQVRAYNWLTKDPNLENFSEAQRLQRFALACFYYAGTGEEWLDNSEQNTWLDYNTHECQWFPSVQPACANYDDEASVLFEHHPYISLGLSGRSLDGQFVDRIKGLIAPELALLTALQALDVGFQRLRGPIPTELGALSNSLRRIVLYENDLTGTIPESLFAFSRDLWLSKNKFSRSAIPTSIGLNNNLRSMLLIECLLTGTIPAELFHSESQLVEFKLEKNELEGPIPSEVGLATNLRELQLPRNRLSLALPSEIGLLPDLQTLNLHTNQLTGTIPTELGNLSKLQLLDLEANRFTGTLATELANLRELRRLMISSRESSNSGLTGPIPMEYFVRPEGNYGRRRLQLNETGEVMSNDTLMWDGANDTETTGRIARASFPFLQQLWIEDTSVSGAIPSEIALMKNIQTIRLGWNRQTPPGTIPTELGLLSNTLVELSLADIELQSTIPSELGRLTKLKKMVLQGNNLTGSLPPQFATLGTSLELFEVYDNPELEGSVPNELCLVEPKTLGCPGDQYPGWGATSLCGCHCPPCATSP